MTTHILDGVGKSIAVGGEGGAFVIENGAHNSGFFDHDGNSFFIINGVQNSAFFIHGSANAIFIQGVGNHAEIVEPFKDYINVSGVRNSVTLGARGGYVEDQNTIVVSGVNNDVGIGSGGPHGGGTHDTINDNAMGTKISLLTADIHLTIHDFQHDQNGTINLSGLNSYLGLNITASQAAAMEHSDGHGGTLLAFSFNGAPNSTIDFVGDAHVAASHFV